MRFTALSIPTALLLAATSCTAEPTLETEEQKTAYAVGVWLGRNLEVFDLTPEEFELFEAGLHDRVHGKEIAVDMDEYEPKILALGQERTAGRIAAEKAAGAALAEREAALPGAERLESGLVYRELEAGDGEQPTFVSIVKIRYEGRLADGTVFDSSLETGEPHLFGLNRVIPCWNEGIRRMRVGSKAVLVCPPQLAYGDTGFLGGIPPAATLRFEVELLDFEDPLAEKAGE